MSQLATPTATATATTTTTTTTPATTTNTDDDPYAATRQGIADPADGKVALASLSSQCFKIAMGTKIGPDNKFRPGGSMDIARLLQIRLNELESGKYPERALVGDGSQPTPSLSEQIAILKRIIPTFKANVKDSMDHWDDMWNSFGCPGNQLTDAQYNEVALNPTL